MLIGDWLQRKREEKELQRRMELTRAKNRIQRHVHKQQAFMTRLWDLAKRSRRLGDEAQLKQILKFYALIRQNVYRCEQYLLRLETMEAFRDSASAMKELVDGLRSVGESLMASTNPQGLLEVQRLLEQGAIRFEQMSEAIDQLLGLADDLISTSPEMSSEELERLTKEIEESIAQEALQEERDEFDLRIEEGLRRIEEAMSKEKK
jgi:hypothetical protein